MGLLILSLFEELFKIRCRNITKEHWKFKLILYFQVELKDIQNQIILNFITEIYWFLRIQIKLILYKKHGSHLCRGKSKHLLAALDAIQKQGIKLIEDSVLSGSFDSIDSLNQIRPFPEASFDQNTLGIFKYSIALRD